MGFPLVSAGIGGSLHVAGVLLEREGRNQPQSHFPTRGYLRCQLLGRRSGYRFFDPHGLVKPLALFRARIRVCSSTSGERSPMLPMCPTS
jgi:ribosomal protein S14